MQLLCFHVADDHSRQIRRSALFTNELSPPTGEMMQLAEESQKSIQFIPFRMIGHQNLLIMLSFLPKRKEKKANNPNLAYASKFDVKLKFVIG